MLSTEVLLGFALLCVSFAPGSPGVIQSAGGQIDTSGTSNGDGTDTYQLDLNMAVTVKDLNSMIHDIEQLKNKVKTAVSTGAEQAADELSGRQAELKKVLTALGQKFVQNVGESVEAAQAVAAQAGQTLQSVKAEIESGANAALSSMRDNVELALNDLASKNDQIQQALQQAGATAKDMATNFLASAISKTKSATAAFGANLQQALIDFAAKKDQLVQLLEKVETMKLELAQGLLQKVGNFLNEVPDYLQDVAAAVQRKIEELEKKKLEAVQELVQNVNDVVSNNPLLSQLSNALQQGLMSLANQDPNVADLLNDIQDNPSEFAQKFTEALQNQQGTDMAQNVAQALTSVLSGNPGYEMIVDYLKDAFPGLVDILSQQVSPSLDGQVSSPLPGSVSYDVSTQQSVSASESLPSISIPDFSGPLPSIPIPDFSGSLPNIPIPGFGGSVPGISQPVAGGSPSVSIPSTGGLVTGSVSVPFTSGSVTPSVPFSLGSDTPSVPFTAGSVSPSVPFTLGSDVPSVPFTSGSVTSIPFTGGSVSVSLPSFSGTFPSISTPSIGGSSSGSLPSISIPGIGGGSFPSISIPSIGGSFPGISIPGVGGSSSGSSTSGSSGSVGGGSSSQGSGTGSTSGSAGSSGLVGSSGSAGGSGGFSLSSGGGIGFQIGGGSGSLSGGSDLSVQGPLGGFGYQHSGSISVKPSLKLPSLG